MFTGRVGGDSGDVNIDQATSPNSQDDHNGRGRAVDIEDVAQKSPPLHDRVKSGLVDIVNVENIVDDDDAEYF